LPRKKKHKPGESQPPRYGGYAHNPGIDRQRDTVAYWRNEAKRTRPAADAMIIFGIGERAVLDYLSILACAMSVGYHGVSKPLSGTGSQMGQGYPAALALVRAELRVLAARTKPLERKLEILIGESAELPPPVVDGKGIRKSDTLSGPPVDDDADEADAA
jgi:hypothetical protein